jgi:uncharacterized membrane protein YdbT with pleckstrin-like domain
MGALTGLLWFSYPIATHRVAATANIRHHIPLLTGDHTMKELYAEHPVMFKNRPFAFIFSLILVPVGVGIIIFLVWHLRNKGSKLTVTETDVLFEKGLLSKSRSEVNIDSIRTVKVHQTFGNRIFGTGKIELYTAGDTPEIVALGMPNPNEVRELIRNAQNKA